MKKSPNLWRDTHKQPSDNTKPHRQHKTTDSFQKRQTDIAQQGLVPDQIRKDTKHVARRGKIQTVDAPASHQPFDQTEADNDKSHLSEIEANRRLRSGYAPREGIRTPHLRGQERGDALHSAYLALNSTVVGLL